MRQETYKDYTRVNASKAERLFNEGKEVLLFPCMARTDSPWYIPCAIDNTKDGTWQQHINAFIWYNCDTTMGTYPKYFIKAVTE